MHHDSIHQINILNSTNVFFRNCGCIPVNALYIWVKVFQFWQEFWTFDKFHKSFVYLNKFKKKTTSAQLNCAKICIAGSCAREIVIFIKDCFSNQKAWDSSAQSILNFRLKILDEGVYNSWSFQTDQVLTCFNLDISKRITVLMGKTSMLKYFFGSRQYLRHSDNFIWKLM